MDMGGRRLIVILCSRGKLFQGACAGTVPLVGERMRFVIEHFVVDRAFHVD